MRIGYHASHEQFAPGHLLELVQRAERAGFTAAMSSDHFRPWGRKQGHSGYAWSWLGAAMQATSLPFGVVTAPGQRYHPAIAAQKIATLEEMFPGRLWVALGSGQNVNESVTGEPWPPKHARNDRLLECHTAIKAMLRGEEVTQYGHTWIEAGRIYSLPRRPPPLIAAALEPSTAEWAGGWADGLITTSRPRKELQKMVDAFRRGGGEGKPMYLKVQLSYSSSYERALQGAREQWSTVIFPPSVSTELPTPEAFDAAAALLPEEAVEQHVRVSSDPQEMVHWLLEDLDLGFDDLYLHNVNKEQELFIDDFGSRVLPSLLPP